VGEHPRSGQVGGGAAVLDALRRPRSRRHVLDHGATFGRSSGAWSYGAPAEARGGAELPPGPIRLAVRIEQDPPQTHAFTIDCQGQSEGIEDPEAVCAIVERDWIALLAPVVGDVDCGGPAGISTVTVEGTVGGVELRRVYGACTSQTVGRWEELLGVARQ
jgi:hypothetical protein